jgi:hypothetical protein
MKPSLFLYIFWVKSKSFVFNLQDITFFALANRMLVIRQYVCAPEKNFYCFKVCLRKNHQVSVCSTKSHLIVHMYVHTHVHPFINKRVLHLRPWRKQVGGSNF